MKQTLLMAFCFFSTLLSAQDLIITPSGPGVKSSKVVKVKTGKEDLMIPITLRMKQTDKDVSVSIIEDITSTAQPTDDYLFAQSISSPLVLNNENGYSASIYFTVRADSTPNEGPKNAVIVFSWEDFSFSTKRKFDTLTIQMDDQPTKGEIDDSSNTDKLEFVQFTDFLGFQNDRPNGLLQQEFRFKWALHRKKIPLGKEGLYLQYFRSAVFDLLLNRIDKSQQEIDYSYPSFLPGSDPKDSVSRKLTTMDILKYTNLQIATRLVLLALHTKHYRLHLQTGVRYMRNRPFYADTIRSGIDSGKVRSDFRSVSSFAPNIEIYLKTLDSKESKVYMDLILGVMRLRLKDTYYSQYDAAVVDEFNRAKVIVPISKFPKRKTAAIWYTSLRLAKDFGEENANAIFFRINYFYQRGKYNAAVRQPPAPQPGIFVRDNFHNHFLQIQIGATLGLDNLFKGRKDKESDKEESKSSENVL